MINFTGQYISPLTISKRQTSGEFTPHEVSYVKLDPKNFEDVKALSFAVHSWDNPKQVAMLMVQDICGDYSLSDEFRLSPVKDYFVATFQHEGFDKLDYKAIVGAIEISDFDPKTKYIEYFEVNPKYSSKNVSRNLKNIGHSMMNATKDYYPDKDLRLTSLFSSWTFYLKEGFREVSKTCESLIFRR